VRTSTSIVAYGALLLSAGPSLSHHSFSAEFDIGRPVVITGTVTRVEWTNPHTWIFLKAEDDQGEAQDWAVELLGINTLMRRGLTRNSISPGDILLIEGYGARDGTNTANASVVSSAETGEEIWATAAGDRK
jgi:Family of unknown function (DUF6152)